MNFVIKIDLQYFDFTPRLKFRVNFFYSIQIKLLKKNQN